MFANPHRLPSSAGRSHGRQHFDAPAAALAELLDGRHTLEDAIAKPDPAITEDPGFDLGAQLQQLIATGLISGFTLADCSPSHITLDKANIMLDKALNTLVATPARAFNHLQDIFVLGMRLFVGWQFFKAGLLKIQNWDSTVFLFQYEYQVPLLSPTLAAITGTVANCCSQDWRVDSRLSDFRPSIS
ncbi:MAG: DoxX family protein [Candidatus Rariloculaceae bacterium]